MENLYPDELTVLFNLAGLWWQLGDNAKVRSYLERLEEKLEGREVTAEFSEKVAWLKQQVTWLIGPDDFPALVEAMAEERRKQVEAKPLPVNAKLVGGLKNMPAIWLDGICNDRGIEPARTRKERQQQIIAHLSEGQNLEEIIRELDGEDIELLRFLLEKGGWSRISTVTRKFGSMEGDGYYWHEEAPLSPLGYLWSRALVFVGRTPLNGRNCRIAVIPVELRDRLSRLLLRKGSDP